ENLKIKVTYYYKNDFHQWKGEIEKMDSIAKQITLSSDEKNNRDDIIKIEDIIDIEILNL
ncbi:MAG: YolD-like family protein, partial [Bacillota bacterium]